MQDITFAKGNEQHLKDCKDALCQSTLGERYFSSPASAEITILEGIRQENLYVAFIGEECVGFTYIIPKGAFHTKRFYERNGYQQVGEIPNLYRSGVTEYIMAKDLKSA